MRLALLQHYLAKLLDVVAVDNDGVEAKSVEPFAVDLHVVLERCRFRLAQSVDVEDGAQVVQLVVAGKMQGFPNRALGAFTIADQAVRLVGRLVKVLADVSHAAGHAQALAQRARRHIDEVKARRGMAFQIRIDLKAIRIHLLLVYWQYKDHLTYLEVRFFTSC